YLTPEEADQIHQQFHDPNFSQTRQVLWTGVERGLAEQWADQRGMQTLTMAMGCLMQPEHPSCLRTKKSNDAWSRYVKGASAIFAHYAAQGQAITVLSPPPPDRFHPSGWTNFQIIEEPILKGQFGGSPVGRIELVHPGVPGAEDFRYELWPTDRGLSWMEKFGKVPVKKVAWRQVTLRLYRPSGLNSQEFMRYCDTCSDKIALQSSDGKKLLSILSELSRIEDREMVAVRKQITQTPAMPRQKEAKKKPIPLAVTGEFMVSITSAKKKEKKSQAKKSKKPEPAARKVAGKGTKATVNKVTKTKAGAKKAAKMVINKATPTRDLIEMRQNEHERKKKKPKTKTNNAKAGKL
ncbi:hypothetical protein LTR96_011708, partial [Exophiala xenobiotica]